MKKLFAFISAVFFVFVFFGTVYADCRGCCSRSGGVTCRDGVTICADGTQLSEKCIAKGCNVCPEDDTTATPDTIKIASFKFKFLGGQRHQNQR